ncbi:MAG: hypothetical protein KAS57_08270 [Gammaproteobacteria bacterium]|nr:hypothetical protein [Gammaproteobacteria bacterium]
MKTLTIFLALLLMNLTGCAGYQTFNHIARSNDTVTAAAGRMQTFTRENLRVTITDADGTETVYAPGNTNIRAVINLYPDPLSNIISARETRVSDPAVWVSNADLINVSYTDGDNDWWQTSVFINLPDNMAIDHADIIMESIDPSTAEVLETATAIVQIVSGVGAPHPFSAKWPWGASFNLTSSDLKALERSSHYQIDFSGSEIPTALSLEITHTAGAAFVVNPSSEKKNIHWTDDGTTAKVLIMPTKPTGFSSLHDLKLYVTGLGVEDVAVSNLQAFDQNGNEIFTVSANTPIRR